jgi:hypothetical protein
MGVGSIGASVGVAFVRALTTPALANHCIASCGHGSIGAQKHENPGVERACALV